MKKVFAAMVAVLFLLIMAAEVPDAKADVYPKLARVYEIDTENDLVFVEDANGFLWAFYGAEDWWVSDLVVMLMDDNGTDVVFDDIIVSTRYTIGV